MWSHWWRPEPKKITLLITLEMSISPLGLSFLFCNHHDFLPKGIKSEIRTSHFVSRIKKGNYRLSELKIILDVLKAILALGELGFQSNATQISVN